jgi:valyl-tRNA synthetase
LSKLKETAQQVNTSFENEFDMHNGVKVLRSFYYASFFDFYLESTKPLLQSSDLDLVELVWNIMRICNHNALLMYHPFMPSITEELWQLNSGFCDQSFSSILDFEYPTYEKFKIIEVCL